MRAQLPRIPLWFGYAWCTKIRGPACRAVWRVAEKPCRQILVTDIELGFPVVPGFSFDAGVDFIADARELEHDTTSRLATLLAIKVDSHCLKGIVLREETDSQHSRLGYFKVPVDGDEWAYRCVLPFYEDWEEKVFTVI